MKVYQYYTPEERIIVFAHDKSEACLVINKQRTEKQSLVTVDLIKEINPIEPRIVLWLKN